MKKLICIPTYNEVENIGRLIDEIHSLSLGFDIMVIDDNSPDGTSAVVSDIMKNNDRTHLLVRDSKQGLASAYLAGFRFGIEKNYDYISEMDADFSHRPQALIGLNKILEENQYDFLIGSRYVTGGKTVNWGIIRKLISRGGSFYARTILGLPILDLTGGFNFWSKSCLEKINIDEVISEGYVFQVELKARAFKEGMRFIEHPIIFEDRRVGQSKMSKKIVFEAMYKVILLRSKLSEKYPDSPRQ